MTTSPATQSDSAVREIAYVAVFAALIVALTLFPAIVLPFTPVPITLQTFAVSLAAIVLGARRGTISVAIYLALIAIGLPVAAGYVGGLGVFAGATGGFLVGFLVQAAVTGLLATWVIRHKNANTFLLFLAALAGTVPLFVIGTAWLMAVTGLSLGPAIAAAVTPFILGDIIKSALAALVSAGVFKALPALAERHR